MSNPLGQPATEKEMILNDQEIRYALALAKYHKIERIRFNANRGWGDTDFKEGIELNQEETDKALRHANSNKHTRIAFEQIRAENRARVESEKAELIAKWDYKQFFKKMRVECWNRTGKDLIFNAVTERLIKTVCYRLSGDAKYETELGYSFGKGLILRGSVGLGKTFIFDLVKDNPVCSVQMITMHEIIAEVIEKGDYKGARFASYGLVYFDDVGTEYFGDNAIKRYGTEINWFKTFIETVYSKDKTQLRRIVFSTNDNADTMEKKYGFRVRDRLAEMFDVLDLHGESMRRK